MAYILSVNIPVTVPGTAVFIFTTLLTYDRKLNEDLKNTEYTVGCITAIKIISNEYHAYFVNVQLSLKRKPVDFT